VGTNRNGWRGTVAPDGRSIRISVTGTVATYTLALPEALIWPDRLTAALLAFDAGTEAPARIVYLDPSAASPVELYLEKVAPGHIRTSTVTDGYSLREESFWLDAHAGTLVRRERSVYGVPITWDPCRDHCDAKVDRPLDVMSRLIVSSPFRVPRSAFAGPIRYVISRTDGDTPSLPATGEQSVVLDGSRAVVTICASCGESAVLTEDDRKLALESNAWVQSDSDVVRRFANRSSAAGTPDEVMSQLVEAVRKHMTGPVDYLGYATAQQALRTRGGDCTEFAVLLAALARARGIPARVAFGLVYSERFSGKKEVFSPHAWVLAWTGTRWKSYDAGIGSFDATHIALAIGDGDPRDRDAASSATDGWRIEKLGLVK
jgi:transglutaminase-like putative cysteine protease